jgi:hypothetical protein
MDLDLDLEIWKGGFGNLKHFFSHYRVGKNDYLNEFKYFNPWISNNGLITWVPEVRLSTKCSMKIRNFPFDTQCCEIR